MAQADDHVNRATQLLQQVKSAPKEQRRPCLVEAIEHVKRALDDINQRMRLLEASASARSERAEMANVKGHDD